MASIALEKIEPDIKTVAFPDGHEMLLVDGTYFAAEKILDRAFMCAIAEEMGAQNLIVAIPKKSMMLLADAASTPEQLDRLRKIAESTYENEGSPDALYPIPFLVSEGRVVDIAVDNAPPSVKKKGFFRRLSS